MSQAAGIHRPDSDGLLTLLAGRTTLLAVQEPDIRCSWLLTSDHRKPNGAGTYSSNDLAELFSIGRAVVYGTLQRIGGR